MNTTLTATHTPSPFMEGYLNTITDITHWGLAHPKAYIATALLINAATITAGATVGDWSMAGVLKFWLVATITAIIIGTPTFKLAMWATKK